MSHASPRLIRIMAVVAAGVIALLPFHAFLTVFGASIFGHYTALRLWKEAVLLLLVVGASVLLAGSAETRRRLAHDRLFWLIGGYFLLLVICGLFAKLTGQVTSKALAYGWLLDGRFLIFFAVCWIVTQQDDLLVRYWQRLLLIPAMIVVGFATLQYMLLPHDFLQHFGYGPATIPPSETVDKQAAYTRIQSTLRGANPLGAYLLVVISALAAPLTVDFRQRRYALGLLLSGMALFFTFSRSAWLGTLASLLLLLFVTLRSDRSRRVMLLAAAVFVLCGLIVGISLRHNDHFQNVFFHTSDHSASARSSNAGHLSALSEGLNDIAHQPFGSGPGTAGPASVYNGGTVRIAENFYVQIGQETGVLGLALFAAITATVLARLYRARGEALPLVLFVSGTGLIIVNMLSHAWADDTLAYIWWGLAGVALCPAGAMKKVAVPVGRASSENKLPMMKKAAR